MSFPSEAPEGEPLSVLGSSAPPALSHCLSRVPTHLLKLLGFVLVRALEEVEQDDVTEDSPLEKEKRQGRP